MEPTKRQLRAYFLVNVQGESMTKAGKLMGGISAQAVSGLLARFEKNHQRGKRGHKYML